jgi:hypothetical protein
LFPEKIKRKKRIKREPGMVTAPEEDRPRNRRLHQVRLSTETTEGLID